MVAAWQLWLECPLPLTYKWNATFAKTHDCAMFNHISGCNLDLNWAVRRGVTTMAKLPVFYCPPSDLSCKCGQILISVDSRNMFLTAQVNQFWEVNKVCCILEGDHYCFPSGWFGAAWLFSMFREVTCASLCKSQRHLFCGSDNACIQDYPLLVHCSSVLVDSL